MSKYDKLWDYVAEQPGESLDLSFEEIGDYRRRASRPLVSQLQEGTAVAWLAGRQDLDEEADRAFRAHEGLMRRISSPLCAETAKV